MTPDEAYDKVMSLGNLGFTFEEASPNQVGEDTTNDPDYIEWLKGVDNQCYLSLGVTTFGLPDREWEGAYLLGLTAVAAIEEQLDCDLSNLDINDLLDKLYG